MRITLVQGDITKTPVDAICNAANSRLAGGGGVDGAIHRAAGKTLRDDLDDIVRRQGGCKTGLAVATRAGNLPAEFVFHAVGPVYQDGSHGEAAALKSCYVSCLRLADERGVRRISFPSISTGVYGYPVELAAPVALGAVLEYERQNTTGVEEVIFVLFDARTLEAYQRAYDDLAAASA